MHTAEQSQPSRAPALAARRAHAGRLIAAIQDLSLARSLDDVMRVVRSAARELSGADGATFVLREGDACFYADEDAIEPLWKGRRFPMAACISGWAMLNRASAVIEDIYADPRIPAAAYRPTFVKSLAMVPIRTAAPIGAIGIYWARRHRPAPREVQLLQALADSTSIALENVELYRGLEARVAERTRQLETANAELRELQRQKQELSALLVHDIKGPAAAMRMCAQVQLRHGATGMDADQWRIVLSAADRINRMALDLLDIARSESGQLLPKLAPVSLAAAFDEIASAFAASAAARGQRLRIGPVPEGIELRADEELLRRVLYNLVDNSLRYAGPGDEVRVEARAAGESVELIVADTGPGIPPADRERVFEKYVRLARPGDAGAFPVGRGLGLAFCRLAVEAHGGTIRIEANQPRGTRFLVALPAPR